MKKILITLLFALLMNAPLLLSAQVFSIPYFNEFETGAPGWVAVPDTTSIWELGMPTYGITNSTYSGTHCWDVNLDSAYTNSSNSILKLPTFNFGTVNNIKISFWQNRNCEIFWDGLVLEYSTDTVNGWYVVGSMGAPGSVNWYNEDQLASSSLPAWTGNSNGWIKSSIILPNNFLGADVYFRFRFTADGSINMDGVSIDDFAINEAEVNIITGTVFLDTNNDYIIDAGDVPYQGIVVSSTQGNTTEMQPSDNNGNYYFIADSGSTFNISATPPQYADVNPLNYVISFAGSNQVDSNNHFLVTFLENVIDVGLVLNQTGVRPGFSTTTNINYYNQGTTITSGTISLEYDPAFTFLNATQSSTTIATNTLEFTYTNLLPGQSANISANFIVNSNLPLGTLTNVSAIIYPLIGDTLITNNYDSVQRPAVNSFDPNDKRVVPEGDITLQQVASGIDLNYTINFQNTGTAPAFDINLYDDLSENLDLSTFIITASSHPISSWSVDVNRLLHFEFADINLPDSVANEPASHGYVKYKVRPYQNLLVGQSINNQAAIYFDNNLPVLTNITSNFVIDPTGLSEFIDDESLFVFPNPTSGVFYLKTNIGNYQVLNALGEQVFTGTVDHASELQTIDLSNVPKGLYLIMVKGANSVQTSRVIVK